MALHDIPLPPLELRFMGENDEKFLQIGAQCASLLRDAGLRGQDSILDIGCGYGRLAFGIVNSMEYKGRYEGFDILGRHIAWCRNNFTPRHPNFQFSHIDVKNDWYKPGGTLSATSLRFPYNDNAFDCSALFSVFTHMFEADIRHYISEINRVTRTGGTCVATFFLFNKGRMPAVLTSPELPMKYEINSMCRYHNPDDMLHAISYNEDFIRNLWTESGFDVTDLRWGSWTGEESDQFQDTLILVKT